MTMNDMETTRMTDESTNLIHPATQAILNRITVVEKYMEEGKFIPAFEVMEYIVYAMDPSDRAIKYTYPTGLQRDIVECLNNEEKSLRAERSREKYAKRTRERRYIYREWLKMIVNQLHNKGYLDGSKFMAFRDLTGGKPRR